MSFVENVIQECKKIESVLRDDFGATGYGLGQLIRSVVDDLEDHLIRRLKKIARIRNRLVHEADYSHEEDEQASFLEECKSAHARLRKLASPAQPAPEPDDGSALDDEELDAVREDAIAAIGDALETIEQHRISLADISGKLEDGALILVNSTNRSIEMQVDSDSFDEEDDEQSMQIRMEPGALHYIPDESTVTIRVKHKGRTKVEVLEFRIDSETCLFYQMTQDADNSISINPDPSLLERILDSMLPNE